MNLLIDPENVINYNRSKAELELFWLFCLVVAGKTAKTQARLLEQFLVSLPGETPFDRIRRAENNGILLEEIRRSRLGQYNRLNKAFSESLKLDLRTSLVADFEAIYGCGPKTARMFLMMSRPNQRHAALDTHLLKHLRANGIDAPKATPSAGLKYRRLEEEFLMLVDESGMEVAEYDLMIWRKYSQKR